MKTRFLTYKLTKLHFFLLYNHSIAKLLFNLSFGSKTTFTVSSSMKRFNNAMLQACDVQKRFACYIAVHDSGVSLSTDNRLVYGVNHFNNVTHVC